MYKVLIADDERLVRIGVKSSIEWEKLDLVLVGEAGNGKEALELIEEHKPDIILLDIGMPIMDGIQVLQIMKQRGIKAQVLVLSCHNEIDYVKQAIKLGAFDYILKLSLKTEDLEKLIIEMKNQIHQQDSISFQDPREAVADYLHKLANYQSGDPDLKSVGPVADFLRELGEKDFHLLLVDLDKKTHQELNLYQNILCEISRTVLKEAVPWYYGISNYSQIILLCGDIPQELLETLVVRVSAALESYTNAPFYIGVSESFCGQDRLPEAIRQADSALSQCFYKNDHVFWAKDAVPYQETSLIQTETENAIYGSIEAGDFELTRELIDQIFDDAMENHLLHPRVFKGNMIEIANLFVKYLKIYELSLSDITEDHKYDCFFQTILQFKDIVGLKEYYNRFIDDYAQKISELKKTKNRDDILEAKTFIEENYQKQISLGDVANHVNMSKNYFSYVFKKETGESYVNYLNQVRVNEAKKLFLTGNYKVYEVAELVGYNNTNYFNEIFKKITGQSPNTFKK